jgi:hypothetical protein
MVFGIRASVAHFAGASAFFLVINAIAAALYSAFYLFLQDAPRGMDMVVLPFGALMLLTWVYGWIVVPLILPAALLSQVVVYGAGAFDAGMIEALLLNLICFPLAFAAFRLGGIDARMGRMALNWRVFVLVGLVASITMATVQYSQLEWSLGSAGHGLWRGMLAAVIKDMIGLLLVMYGLMMVFRLQRHSLAQG